MVAALGSWEVDSPGVGPAAALDRNTAISNRAHTVRIIVVGIARPLGENKEASLRFLRRGAAITSDVATCVHQLELSFKAL